MTNHANRNDGVLTELFSIAGLAIGAMLLLAFGYRAQGYPAMPVTGSEPAIPALMFFTLGAGLAVGLFALAYFLNRPSNRAAASDALSP
jgi:hypothetical protein